MKRQNMFFGLKTKFDRANWLWELPTMNATVLDERRRIVLPREFKPRSAVTMQLLDEETVLVKLVKPSAHRMVMLLSDVKSLPAEPKWERVELALAKRATKKLPPPEE